MIAKEAHGKLTSVLADLLRMDGARLHATSMLEPDSVSITLKLPRNDKWTPADYDRAMRAVAMAMDKEL